MSKLISNSIARRLALGFAGVLMLLAGVVATSSVAMRSVTSQMKQIVEINNRKTALANDMLHSINRMGLHSRTLVVLYDVKQIQAEADAVKRAVADYRQAQDELQAALQHVSSSDDERKLLSDVIAAGQATLPELDAAVKLGIASDSVAAVETFNGKVRPNELRWSGGVSAFITLQGRLVGEATAAAAAAQHRAAVAEFALFALALTLGSLIAWRITLGVTRPIGSAVVVAERIAQGDLTTQVQAHQRDETGRLLQAIAAMQERLRSLVGGIRETADSIEATSTFVATGSRNLSQRTEQAASNLKQTTSSMRQLTDALKQSSDSARRANELASSAAAVAGRGGVMVSQVVTTMEAINASSQKIADIVGVIDGLAFQTNILALNAAVEAARSGEQGRGFAVVAGEVRSLAARSAQAAKEIKALIGESVERVGAGHRLVADAGLTMSEIVGSVKRVSDIVGEISLASSEQNNDIDQVNDAVAQLDQVTQRNAVMVERGVASADGLKSQATRLTQMVGAFHLRPQSS